MSKVEGFAAVPNWMVRDENVPGRDVLVYASLASRSGLGGIYPSQQTIAKETQLSERTVRTALRELEELGVIQRVTRRATKRGRSTGLTTMYTLTPNGNLADEEEPAIIAGRSEGPATEEEGTGKSEQVALLIEVEPVEVEPLAFDDFWAVWPKKNSKRDAERAWAKAVKSVDPAVIVAAARAYAESPHRPSLQFVPYGASWLNGERWADPLPEPTARSFAQQKQDNNIALFERYQQEESHAQIGTREAPGLLGIDRGA